MGFETYIRFAMALLLVLGLIALIAWLVRRFGLAGRVAPGITMPGQRRRLSVVESCAVDGRRRLVLVRRDETEHLVMLTANGSGVVIERGIGDDAADTDQSDFRTTLARQADDDWADEEDADPDEALPTRPRGGPGTRP